MKQQRRIWQNVFIVFLAGIMSLFGMIHGAAAQQKVLVVMSYAEEYPWVQEIKEGISAVLTETVDVRYFYMDTKKNIEGGPQKAIDAYELFQEFQPDGVIAVDDNAQSMFVVPYLKDKVDTPVMFCGVNAEAEKYGYPASNVSGILERHHISESIAFVRQLVPTVKSVAFLMRDNPSAQAVFEQVEREKDTYPAEVIAFTRPTTVAEAFDMVRSLKDQADALFLETMIGLVDENGHTLARDDEIIPQLAEAFGKPTFSGTLYHIKSGVFCAIIKTGQEHGEVAASMLLEAMQGTPVSDIPIVTNKRGRRLLNVTTMKALGIKPKPHVLQGVEFIKSGE